MSALRLYMPWSIRFVLVLALAGASAFVWSKRPFISDARKVCVATQTG
jgi:hypothetical protein